MISYFPPVVSSVRAVSVPGPEIGPPHPTGAAAAVITGSYRLARGSQCHFRSLPVLMGAIYQRKDHSAHPAVRRSARDCAAVAGFSVRHEPNGAAKARFSRYLLGPLTIELARLPERWKRAVGVPVALPLPARGNKTGVGMEKKYGAADV